MIRLGISGHQTMPNAAHGFVLQALERELTLACSTGQLWGITSLAVGADQMFAELVLRAGAKLHVVIPSFRYEEAFDVAGLNRYRVLLAAAAKRERLDYLEPSQEAFLAAGRRVVDHSDRLLAVWDGEPSRGRGGTADIVDYAKSIGKEVAVVWPTGVVR